MTDPPKKGGEDTTPVLRAVKGESRCGQTSSRAAKPREQCRVISLLVEPACGSRQKSQLLPRGGPSH